MKKNENKLNLKDIDKEFIKKIFNEYTYIIITFFSIILLSLINSIYNAFLTPEEIISYNDSFNILNFIRLILVFTLILLVRKKLKSKNINIFEKYKEHLEKKFDNEGKQEILISILSEVFVLFILGISLILLLIVIFNQFNLISLMFLVLICLSIYFTYNLFKIKYNLFKEKN